MKPIVPLIVSICLFAVPLLVHAEEKGIVVSGTGTVRVKPDIAEFRAVVLAKDNDAARASATAARIWQSMQQALRKAGIAESDSPSEGYSVNPEWIWDQGSGRNRLNGYTVRHTVKVTVRDLSKTGAAVDAVVGSGVGDVQPVRFLSSRFDALRRQALELAVANARRDAESIARAAGGRLGTLLRLDAQSAGAGRPAFADAEMMVKAAAPAPTTEIAPAEEEVVATVQGRWGYVGK